MRNSTLYCWNVATPIHITRGVDPHWSQFRAKAVHQWTANYDCFVTAVNWWAGIRPRPHTGGARSAPGGGANLHNWNPLWLLMARSSVRPSLRSSQPSLATGWRRGRLRSYLGQGVMGSWLGRRWSGLPGHCVARVLWSCYRCGALGLRLAWRRR